MSENILLGAAFVAVVAAIVIYISKESNSYEGLSKGVESYGQISARIERENKNLRDRLDAITEWQGVQQEINEKQSQRLQLMDMRLDAAKSHGTPQFPKSIKVEIAQPIELVTKTPLKVLHREAKRVPTLPRGKAVGP